MNKNNVLILSSIDERFDFELLDEIASILPEINFHIYGHISKDDADMSIRFFKAIESRKNLTYKGKYNSDEIEKILSEYHITLAPYRTESTLTRYIDPLRFYHSINGGLELITTKIPAYDEFKNSAHLALNSTDAANIIKGLNDETLQKLNNYTTQRAATWRDRAITLLGHIDKLS